MSFSGQLRRHMFWTQDAMNGGLVRNHLDHLQQSFANPEYFFRNVQPRRLRNLLNHAVQTTEQYNSLQGYSSLQDFPVIPKEYIIDHYAKFVSLEYNTSKLDVRRTSGSYGTPFAVHFDRNKLKSQWTEILYFNQQAGYRLGEPFLQLRVHEKSKLALLMQNSTILKPETISENWLQNSRRILLDKKYHFMITYPASLLLVAMYCREKGDTPDHFGFKNIISSGEILTENARRIITRVFGARVHDRYATLETGVLAHQCAECGHYHVNFPNYHIELLRRDSSEPVGVGELGRVVVTDYQNKVVPLVRYDIGDVSEWVGTSESCQPHIPTLRNIVGRKDDFVVNAKGELISPVTIFEAVALENNYNVVQYQLVQTDHHQFTLNMVVTQEYNSEAVIRKRLINCLGPSAQIKFEYMEEIPPLPSGKRPVIINQYSPSM